MVLKSSGALGTDSLIKQLWEFTQRDEFYRNNTVFIITTDHGRGTDPLETWTGHGDKVKNAGGVWLALFGKGVAPLAETSKDEQLYSNQIAPTILELLGLKVSPTKMKGKTITLGAN